MIAVETDPLGNLEIPRLEMRGHTIIDLCGRCAPEEWSPWGACYSTHMPEQFHEVGKLSTIEADRFVRRIRSKAQAIAVLMFVTDLQRKIESLDRGVCLF